MEGDQFLVMTINRLLAAASRSGSPIELHLLAFYCRLNKLYGTEAVQSELHLLAAFDERGKLYAQVYTHTKFSLHFCQIVNNTVVSPLLRREAGEASALIKR